MSKPILVAFLVILLAGSGVVFANTELPNDLLGFYAEFVEEQNSEDETDGDNVVTSDDDSKVGDNRSDVAEAVHDALTGDENGLKPGDEDFGQEVSEAARNANGSAADGDAGDNKSDVAKAVHDALTGEDNDLKPGDEGFGQAVADQAKDPEVDLGKDVSDAARNANDSIDTDSDESGDGTNGDENLTQSEKIGSPGNSGNAGNPWSSGAGGSPGNSGNAGGGGSPGNSGNANRP